MSSSKPSLMSASGARPQEGGRWAKWSAILMIACMATLVQSYLMIKLLFLTLFLLITIANFAGGRTRIVVYRRLVLFYSCIAAAGIVWACVGFMHFGNYHQGILEALRLYVVWSAAFLILYSLLRAEPSLDIIHKALVAAGILIPLVNFVGLYDQFSGLGLVSDGIQQELDMRVGIGDGTIQITSHNIGMMFLIAPYLLSLQFRADAGKSNSLLAKLALGLSLILVAVSGRRALWVVIALTPFAIVLVSRLAGAYDLIKAGGKRFLLLSAIAAVVGLGTLIILPESSADRSENGAVSRLKEAFSSEDERAIQKPYLYRAFLKSPLFGSGFGAYAGYASPFTIERPWVYELTYYQMLLNLGIAGVTLFGLLFSLYFGKVVCLLRRFKDGSAIPFGLLVGFCSLLVGAYSNPYLGGFDYLFFVGLFPYLSTFQRGFESSRPARVMRFSQVPSSCSLT